MVYGAQDYSCPTLAIVLRLNGVMIRLISLQETD